MSVYFQHLAFLWPFDTSLFQHLNGQGQKNPPKPDIHASNLQGQDKEIQHIKYEEL